MQAVPHEKLATPSRVPLRLCNLLSIDYAPAPTKTGGMYVAGVISSWISAVAFGRFYLEAKRISISANASGTYGPTGRRS
jgi:hypothetical protein